MTIDTFWVLYDQESGLKYVSKVVDKLTKNHSENDKGDVVDGYMPEIPGTPMSCVIIWKFLQEESCWYTNSPIGEKNIQKFMRSFEWKMSFVKKIYKS